jgi:hypothetical protein
MPKQFSDLGISAILKATELKIVEPTEIQQAFRYF